MFHIVRPYYHCLDKKFNILQNIFFFLCVSQKKKNHKHFKKKLNIQFYKNKNVMLYFILCLNIYLSIY